VLLISSLIVLPNITAITMGKRFKKTAILSCSLSACSVIVSIIVSYIMNIAPSGAIVLTATAIFLTAVLRKHIVRKIGRSDTSIQNVTLRH